MSRETVGDVLDEMDGKTPAAPAVATKIEAPRLDGQPPFPAVGIYFGMPDEVYHSIHAASASGLKKLSISSMDYWAESLLNPEKEEAVAKDSGDMTPRQLGQAYHSYVCEGPAAFLKKYAVALDKDTVKLEADAKGRPLCVTVADIRMAIDALEAKPKGTAKDPLIDQLLDLDPDAFVWERMVAAHNDANKGKVMISSKLFRRIAISGQMISADPNLGKSFKDGHAEVSIFWYDKATGIPMKARLDYLKFDKWVDFKSFGNPQGKPIQRAIDAAIANQKYYIPIVVYDEAIAAAKEMVKAKQVLAVHSWDGGTNKPTKELVEWCWKWAHQPDSEVLFVFQQTGKAPVTRGRIMPRGTTYTVTNSAVQFLKRRWAECAKTYGVDPWLDFQPVVATVDEELNQWVATDFGDTL